MKSKIYNVQHCTSILKNRFLSVSSRGGQGGVYGGPQPSQQNQKPHGKNKNIPHDKTKNLTAKPKTSRQN